MVGPSARPRAHTHTAAAHTHTHTLIFQAAYSNWRGPVWINVNAIMAYTLKAAGLGPAAAALADTVVHTLAQDIRESATWHEAYSSSNGSGLAAPGFLSWNTLGADLQENVAMGVDPFDLE